MTRDLALSLLRTGNDGNQILQILETLTADLEQANIADAAAHYAAISRPDPAGSPILTLAHKGGSDAPCCL